MRLKAGGLGVVSQDRYVFWNTSMYVYSACHPPEKPTDGMELGLRKRFSLHCASEETPFVQLVCEW